MLAIERVIESIAGARYTLALDLAGHPARAADQPRLAISVDGREIGGVTAFSAGESLAWEAHRFDFVGSGNRQLIRIASAAPRFAGEAPGTMIDDIVVGESLPVASGRAGTAIGLPELRVALVDGDGSESLRVTLAGIPAGATLSDGERQFRATAGSPTVDLGGWDLGRLSLRPPDDFAGTLRFDLVATATEQANRSEAGSRTSIAVEVQPRPTRRMPEHSSSGCRDRQAQDAPDYEFDPRSAWSGTRRTDSLSGRRGQWACRSGSCTASQKLWAQDSPLTRTFPGQPSIRSGARTLSSSRSVSPACNRCRRS